MVNTFIVGDFKFTASVLDRRRKLKQAVETRQIITIIESGKTDGGFVNHPVIKMRKSYLDALKTYYNIFIQSCKDDDFNLSKLVTIPAPEKYEMPWFITFQLLIMSHRARLYQKDPVYYAGKFECWLYMDISLSKGVLPI